MYELIEHRRLDSAASSIDFINIPQDGSDLVVFYSIRPTNTNIEAIELLLNNSSTDFTGRWLEGNGSSASSGSTLPLYIGAFQGTTTNTFNSGHLYIPNYSSSTNKSFSVDAVSEANQTAAYQLIRAGLWSNTAAINRVTIRLNGGVNMAQFSSATLYKVNRTAGIGRAPLAMGGYMSYSNGYWVHTFPSSGSFIPFTNMDVEYLVIAGGGGGGANGGGGGAGGYRYVSSQALTGGTNYAVTVGAGGSGASGGAGAAKGSNSVFNTITSTGGGQGASGVPLQSDGSAGGSGGGARAGGGGSFNGGAGNQGGYTPVEGYAGGANANLVPNYGGGGGGGASTPGSRGLSTAGGAGGNGILSDITGTPVFRAGGGGGSAEGGSGGLGGVGGGGNGSGTSSGTSGTANTGSGGGGGGWVSPTAFPGGNGGSGIVIVRYRA